MVEIIKFILNNPVALFVLSYLLIMTPIIGIMLVHQGHE
jgi:hypothetical protein